jgi:hypothetical protein
MSNARKLKIDIPNKKSQMGRYLILIILLVFLLLIVGYIIFRNSNASFELVEQIKSALPFG